MADIPGSAISDTPPSAAAAPRLPARGCVLTDFVSLALVVLALALFSLQPLRVYRCGPQGASDPRLAQCVIADRWLGIVPLRERRLAGIAEAVYGAHVERSETRGTESAPSGTAPHEVLTTVEELTLLDARAEPVWSASASHTAGVSLQAIAADVESLLAGGNATPWVRWYVAWPPWLLGCLFALLGASHLSARAGLLLLARGLAPRSFERVLYWGPTLFVLALFAVVWGIALFGGGPPRWLAALVAPS